MRAGLKFGEEFLVIVGFRLEYCDKYKDLAQVAWQAGIDVHSHAKADEGNDEAL